MYNDIAQILNLPVWLILIVIAWSLVWKGLALWKSATKRHKIWFVLILIINTIGIFEILYYFLFSEIKFDEDKGRKPKRKVSRKKRR